MGRLCYFTIIEEGSINISIVNKQESRSLSPFQALMFEKCIVIIIQIPKVNTKIRLLGTNQNHH